MRRMVQLSQGGSAAEEAALCRECHAWCTLAGALVRAERAGPHTPAAREAIGQRVQEARATARALSAAVCAVLSRGAEPSTTGELCGLLARLADSDLVTPSACDGWQAAADNVRPPPTCPRPVLALLTRIPPTPALREVPGHSRVRSQRP